MNAPSLTSPHPVADVPAGAAGGAPLLSIESAIFKDVMVALTVRLGETTLTVEELLALRDGSILRLDRLLSELVEVHLNGALVARGEIVAVDDNFGVRIIEVAPAA